VLDERLDGCLQIDDRDKDGALQWLFGELGEEAFDNVEPGGRSLG
jgi:hypothetical protein